MSFGQLFCCSVKLSQWRAQSIKWQNRKIGGQYALALARLDKTILSNDNKDMSHFLKNTYRTFFWCDCFLWTNRSSEYIVSKAFTSQQGYRNFEIQIGPLDRWRHRRHTNMSSTIPNSHENSSFSSKSVSEIDYFSDRVQLQPVVSKRSKDNPKSLASDRCLLNTGAHQYPLWCLNPPIFSVSQRVSFFYKVFACV